MNANIQSYVDRAKQYQNIDGTGEMFVGLTLLGFALAGYLEALLPGNSPTWMRVAVVFGSLMLALGLAYWTRLTIKRHITWPRTGYAAYPRHDRSWWVKTTIIRVLVLGTVVGLAFWIQKHHWMGLSKVNWNLSPKVWNPRVVVLIAVGMTAYAVWVFRSGRGYWWKWLVLLFMILGVVMFAVMVPGDFGHWARPPVLFIALLWLGSGAGTLYSYVRRNQSPGSETK